MEGLTEQEQKFFDSGGQTEIVDDTNDTTTEVEPEVKETEASAPPKQAEVPQSNPEKKKPSKFEYQADTDNVVDDLGRKYLPLNAVQEERKENKRLRAEMEELKAKWTGGEAKLNALLQKLQPKEQLPDYAEKPLDHLKAKNEALEKNIQEIKEAEEKRNKESEASNQIAEVQRNILAAERQFSSKTPDYGDALSKVQEVWRAEYEMAGVPEQLIDSLLARKGLQFSHAAMQKDQNPGEAVYKLAQRYGYTKKEVVENKDKDKLKQIAKGQEAEKSLTTGKSGGDMSLEALATMSDDEMDEFVKDPKNWAKLSKAAA